MFKSRSKIDWERTARGLARAIGGERLRQSLRGNYITNEAFAELEREIPWQAPVWSQPTVTSGNIQRREPSLLQLWKMISAPRRAAPAPTPADENWFSANK